MTTNLTFGRKAKFGLAALVVAGTAVVLPGTVGTANAAETTFKLSPATGAAGPSAGVVISVTGKGFEDASGSSLVGVAEFSASATCATAPTVSPNLTVDVLSASRLLVTTVAGNTAQLTITGGIASGPSYNLCVYNTGGTAVLGSAKYTVYTAPSVTAISPNQGLPAGGGAITITGNDFTKAAKATVGGVALKSAKVTVNASGTDTITGVVPAGVMGATRVVVTTEGGASANVVADDYTYVNAISVSPAKGLAGTKISIKGSGFSALSFSGDAAVLFVEGAYDPTDDDATAATGNKTNPEAGVCGSPKVVTDTEIVCVVPALGGNLTVGAYTVTVVNDDRVVDTLNTPSVPDLPTFQSVVSSSSTFTIASF